MSSAFQRFYVAAECRTQIELAHFLGIQQSSISDAKRRGAVPAEWLLKLLRYKGINPDWVLTGEGPRYMRPLDGDEVVMPVVHSVEIRPPQECSAQELVNELVRRALNSV